MKPLWKMGEDLWRAVEAYAVAREAACFAACKGHRDADERAVQAKLAKEVAHDAVLAVVAIVGELSEDEGPATTMGVAREGLALFESMARKRGVKKGCDS